MSEGKELSEDEINKIALKNSLAEFYKKKEGKEMPISESPVYNNPTTPQGETQTATPVMPKTNFSAPEDFQSKMQQESDPDLIVGYEIVDLPSKGKFYNNGLSKVRIEYLTSKDEDVLTTPSLIQDGTVLDVILKRKIKTPNVNIPDLLTGDKNALVIFLRSTSYGHEYEVEVADPRDGTRFKQMIDLTKLNYIEGGTPDANGEFSVELPMRKKLVKFRLLTSGQEEQIRSKADAIQDAYGHEFNEYITMKLKAQIVEIGGRRERDYIERFIDAAPLKDIATIKRKVLDVTPDVDMNYEFKAKDGFKFKGLLRIGVDFFFPNL